MPKPPPQTIGLNPLDLLVPAAPAAALTGPATAPRAASRPQTTVLTVTVPADLADRLEQLILVMPGLNLDTLASEALELVWDALHKAGGVSASTRSPASSKARSGSRRAAKGAAKGAAKSAARRAGTAGATTAAKAKAASARTSARRKGRDADSNGRKVVVILGE